MLALLKRFFNSITDKCPECSKKLDFDTHGYRRRWSHCHNCGYCTYALSFGKRNCGVK